MNLIYNKGINSLLRNLFRPFSKIIPQKFKFPVHGTFVLRGNNVPSFKINTNPTSYFSKKIFWDGIEGFEFNSVKIFCEVLKNSDVFFDIGANIGYYSLLASAIKNKNIEVYAFEPMPSAFDFLKKNIEINQFFNIKPQKLALSNEKGTAMFYSILNEKFKEIPQLTGDGGLSQFQSGQRTKVNFEVKIDTLNNFVSEHLGTRKIDLIKLDTEANEHRVLSGADTILKDHRPLIQCEVLKNQIEKEIEIVMSKYDYMYFRATDKGLVLVNSFLSNNSDFVDYYLVPREKKHLVEKYIKV